MLFADDSLAARIEAAECGLLRACAAAVRRSRPADDIFEVAVAGGIATFAGAGSPLNKVAGLGFAGTLAEERLAAVEASFAQRGEPVQVELACLADPSIGPLLTKRGYQLHGFENVLGLRLPVPDVPPPGEGIEITASGTEDFATWLDVVVTGFSTPDTQGVPSHEEFSRESMERSIGDLAAADGFVRYLARLDGLPAGGASMRLDDGVAQLCGAATLPAHRRHGVQSAFLARRLADAASAGCDVAVVTTQPGSKSQENVQRQGFELLYTRAILRLE